jgi:PKD repeat protein
MGFVTATTTDDLRVAIDASGDSAGVVVEDNYENDCTFGPTDTFSVILVLPAGSSMAPVTPAIDTGTEVDLSGTTVGSPDVAVAGNSELVSWDAGMFSAVANQKASFFDARGNAVGQPQTVGQAVGRGQLALSSSGYALDVFPTAGNPPGVDVSTRAPGGQFSTAQPVPKASGGGSASIDDSGNGVLGFTEGTGPAAVAAVQGFEVSSPALSSVSIAAAATAGKPVSFSAAATDFWGPVTLSWRFGDGGSATGMQVSHTFARAGKDAVQVTATNAVGNAVTRSGTVNVSLPAPVLSHASVKPSQFAPGHGTTLRFDLNERASVTIKIHLAGQHDSVTLHMHGRAGANHRLLGEWVHGKPFSNGRYAVSIVAAAGRLRSRTVTLRFTVTAQH